MELGTFIEHLQKIQSKYGADLEVIVEKEGEEFSDDFNLAAFEELSSRPTVGIFEDEEFSEIGSVPKAFRTELNINSVLIS